ncbi:radical SAM family heme chaperone HemW [Neolewinella antarctica]|uniref:Heme chaperone HemW n=1 Tax=Neolewinella antarctica TaxID=442734 RepID=A0ABX0XHC2_9BACT|nr:radical SAM family heme chaperone HemW [Neolewinella antarctica]NJC28173.1 oxygen-independent coproporphyrinogen-3 oxidase [Neolewinella antarctica]
MLYLHIPFCKQACSYCNFHFSTSMKTRPGVLNGINKELRVRRQELAAGPVPSVYFGGGTPSLLTEEELSGIFNTLVESEYWGAVAGAREVSKQAEITLEANPDDLDERTIGMLAASPVNRLSIGIQSFFEEDLRFMNRAHNAAEARTAIAKVNRAGFHDVSIDLIYGGQTTTDAMWAENLRIATDLGVTHISAYALTVEPKTALGVQVAKGKVADTDDEKFTRHFEMLVDHLTSHGYRHYEVSNFCLPGHESKHNSGYWSGQTYLGIGPGAHGFDGQNTRRWNLENNATYAKVWADISTHADYLAAENLVFEQEILTDRDRYNEYVMTALRREEGLTLDELRERFGPESVPYFSKSQVDNVEAGLFHDAAADGRYRLTRAGIMRADGVASDGFRSEG